MALVFVGLVAGLTIPGLIYSTQSNAGLLRVKALAGEIQRIALSYRADNPDVPPGTEPDFDWTAPGTNPGNEDALQFRDMTNRLKYVSIVTDSSLGTDLEQCTNGNCCSAAIPCYRFADGSTLRFYSHTFPNDHSQDFYGFLVDPDGSGPLSTMNLFLFYQSGRVTTGNIFAAEVGGIATLPDSSYTRNWLQPAS